MYFSKKLCYIVECAAERLFSRAGLVAAHKCTKRTDKHSVPVPRGDQPGPVPRLPLCPSSARQASRRQCSTNFSHFTVQLCAPTEANFLALMTQEGRI